MRVTIIPEDGLVIVDGVAMEGCQFDIDPNVHAVQWDSEKPKTCKAELHNGGSRHIESLDEFQPALDAWQARKDEIKEAQRVAALPTWDKVRAQRGKLLADSDWTQVTDSPLTTEQKQAWADYRQALRDIPEDYGDPGAVAWPEPPQ